MTDQLETSTEAAPAGGIEPRAVLVAEANADRSQLSEKQRLRTGALKKGARSGITGEFGKPEIAGHVPGADPPEILPAAPPAPLFGTDVGKDVQAMGEALDGFGTDEAAVFRILSNKTPERIEQLKRIYRQQHGRELEADLRDELADDDFKRAQELLHPERLPELDERGAERLRSIQSDPELQRARDALKRKFEGQEAPADVMKQVEADMTALEKRAARGNPALTAREIADTYKEIGRLLEHKCEKPTSRSERFELAREVLHQAADPGCVDQGYNGTCQLAALENMTYARKPSGAARMIADMATKGYFETADKTRVTIPERNLHPDVEAAARGAGYEPCRSYASQIFQITAANIKYAELNRRSNPPGKLMYEDGPPVPGTAFDTGERVMDNSKTPPQVVFKGHSLVTSDILPHLSRQITGKQEKNVIQHDEYKNTANAGTIEVKSADDLKNELEKAKKEGRLPLVVQVHTGNEPFVSDVKGAAAAAASGGGWHNVVVTDYDPATGDVYFDNSWGREHDHTRSRPVSLGQLYQATRRPED